MKTKLPGIVLSGLIALIASQVGRYIPLLGGPIMAIALGAIIGNYVRLPVSFQPGLKFSSKVILQAAIVLLGFGLNLSVILKTGWDSLPIIVSTISAALITALVLQKLWKLDVQLATLIGVGSSICGGSAIAATAPVIQADDQDVAQSISVIFFYNLLAAILFPLLGGWLGFSGASGEAFGMFAGTAVNDTSSVTAAATVWDNLHHLGSETLDYAVTVKLTRTLFIIPITLGLSLWRAKQDGGPSTSKAWYQHVPRFLLLFLGASLITSLLSFLNITLAGLSLLKQVSRFFIVMAMGAIGLNTNLRQLIHSGSKPLLLGLACWVVITLTSLGLQHILGIW